MALSWIFSKEYSSLRIKDIINNLPYDFTVEVTEEINVIKSAEILDKLNSSISDHDKKLAKVVSIDLFELTIDSMSKI